MKSRNKGLEVEARALDIEEIRLVADLRIMHAKVDELYQIVMNLQRRHDMADIQNYADQPVLAEDIQHADEIYLWFVGLKEEAQRRIAKKRKA